MPAAVINGARVNYLQLEDGQSDGRQDLVMIHGLATNMAFWSFPYAWQFAKQFRVTLYDLRGHGRSEMTPSGYMPSNLSRDLAGLLDHLGITSAHFVAHSFGGVVAMRFALEHLDRMRSLVLADTHISATRNNRARSEWAFRHAIQSILDRHEMKLDTEDPYFGYKLLTRVAHMQLRGIAVPRELEELINPLMSNVGPRTASQWLQLMQTTSAEAELMGNDDLTVDTLRKFQFPIIAMYGDRSPARITGTELLDVWPHAEFRSIRDAGHFFPASRPDEVVSACQRFWQGDLSNSQRKNRAGEAGRSYFRTDRIFLENGSWYVSTREARRVGPFAEREHAGEALDYLIPRRQ
jgi:pimeloyl-ACP methyl ester carboxylesterase